jgi:1A family penicillin-binding protein
LLGLVTRAVQTVHARVDFTKLALKPDARVPKLQIQDEEPKQVETYPLLSERYLIGRSSKSCHIVVRNSLVSQIHLSLTRNPQGYFVLKDEKSTNGTYRGKRRLSTAILRHGDTFTLGPPELAGSVQLKYIDPPPLHTRAVRYGLYGVTGMTALVALWIGMEWQRFPVRPLPVSLQGPVIIVARDTKTPLSSLSSQTHVELKQLSDFSSDLPKALIASEDSRYYWHLGVDPIGILRALVANIRQGEIREGASTLTQQLARNIFRDYVGAEDSAGRKIREAIVALKLETFYSKDFLLLTYLNRVYLGNGNYGFESAAQFYFGKPAKELTLSEAATLVGILPAPNSFNPIQDYQTSVELRDRVIDRMAAQGKVSQEEAEQARRSRITVSPKAIQGLRNTIAPYFYNQVFSDLELLLGKELAEEGNFIIESTVDPQIQAHAETALKNTVETTGAASGFSQGAMLTVDASTGEILAMVGGVNFQDSQFNRATQAQRQPGSTFKVFAYIAALEQGISPQQTYSCAPLTWDSQTFEGCHAGRRSQDMYRAVADSENVIALRVAEQVGLDNLVQTARRMGIESNLNPIPGLVLGQSEVTLSEITGAYGILANQGMQNPPRTINRILDSSDCGTPSDFSTCRVIYDYKREAGINVQVLQPGVANTMTSLLQGVIQRGTAKHASLGLGEAGKTGTTNDSKDLWFIGYIPSRKLVTGIWLGNDDNAPTAGSSDQAAQLWGNYMRQVVR